VTPLEFLQTIGTAEGAGRPGSVENPHLFDGSDDELDLFMLTCMVVAGKNARIQQGKLWELMRYIGWIPGAPNPMALLHAMGSTGLRSALQHVRMGQYRRLTHAINTFACLRVGGCLNLRTCTRDDLVRLLPGVGLKTASFFLLYTRRGLKGVACLDTHILKFMRDSGLDTGAPKNTPQGPKYLALEKKFTELCEAAGKQVPDVDFDIWSYYSNKNNGTIPHSGKPDEEGMAQPA